MNTRATLISSAIRILSGLVASIAWLSGFSTPGAILHTIGYHQLTQFTNTSVQTYSRSLVMSADGRRLACSCPWYSNQRSNLIYAINFDGSGFSLVDMWPGGGGAQLDINADGSRIISWESGTVRVVNGDGSTPHQVIQINGGYPDLRISPDGTKIYFSNDRGFGTTPDTGNHEPGIYVLNTDGTSFHEVAGQTSFARFFNTVPSSVVNGDGIFSWWQNPFGLSGDGTKLVCYLATTNGWHLLGLNTDGTGLHEFPLAGTPIWNFEKVGLSGDGLKVCYYLNYAPCCSSGEELGVFNWDGTGHQVLWSSYSPNQGSGSLSLHEVSMNHDGSRLLFGETSRLFNTDGSACLQLAWGVNGGNNKILEWGFYHRGLMDSNGTHFAFLSPMGNGSQGPQQVATAELNPADLGLAPAIIDASVTPNYSTANMIPVYACRPTPNAALIPCGVQAGVLLNGLDDDPAHWGACLHDDGTTGDAIKDDGIYSDSWTSWGRVPTIGPRTVRFQADLLGADGRYHQTAIDTAPFFVLAQAPTNPPPTISAIVPTNAPAGTQVTIIGTGFDPITTNNVVLFGNVLVPVVSGNPAGNQLIVVVPAGLPPGPLFITVSSLGQISGNSNLTIPDPYAASLEVKMLAGLQIIGAVGSNYRIDYLPDLNNTNNWSTLTHVLLPSSPFFWVDLSSTNQSRRFYRAVRVP